MGYACPVCGDPQSDAEHLANHLAFTAMLRGDDHEEWLAEHAPNWAEMDETSLAETVRPLVEETDFPQVFEDTTSSADGDGDGDGHDPDSEAANAGASFADPSSLPGKVPDGDLDERAREALAEAREMTRKQRESRADAGSGAEDGEDGAGTEAE